MSVTLVGHEFSLCAWRRNRAYRSWDLQWRQESTRLWGETYSENAIGVTLAASMSHLDYLGVGVTQGLVNRGVCAIEAELMYSLYQGPRSEW